MEQQQFTVTISRHDGMIWGEVVELPGVFASGQDWEELAESLAEAIEMVLEGDAVVRKLSFPKSPPMPTLEATQASLSLAAAN